jgi:hypothetical protein
VGIYNIDHSHPIATNALAAGAFTGAGAAAVPVLMELVNPSVRGFSKIGIGALAFAGAGAVGWQLTPHDNYGGPKIAVEAATAALITGASARFLFGASIPKTVMATAVGAIAGIAGGFAGALERDPFYASLPGERPGD